MPVVYSSSTLSLAALEYLAHVDPEDVPADLVAMQIEIPDDLPAVRVQPSELPFDWNRAPDHPACLARGETWLREEAAAVMYVPSALLPEEENVLIKPGHAEAHRVRVVSIRAFAFDPRLLS